MFGLLGGLLGGRALGGALGGGGGLGGALRNRMMQKRGSIGSSLSSSPSANRSQPAEPEAQEQPEQTSPQQQQPEPEQQPAQQPTLANTASEIEQPKAQEQAEKVSPIKGLLDEAPLSKPVEKGGTGEEPAAPSIVNNTETMTPVARQAGEEAGRVPTMFQTDGVLNQLMDSAGNRQPFEFQEGMPSRTPAIEDRSFQFQGPTSVGGALPARRYRQRV